MDILGIIGSIAGLITLIITLYHWQSGRGARLRFSDRKTGDFTPETPLLDTLAVEGLAFARVQDLCVGHARVSARTISDIAHGRRKGSTRSRIRIVDGLNRYSDRRKDYTVGELFPETPRTRTKGPSEGITRNNWHANRYVEATKPRLITAYKQLLRYLPPELRQELANYLDDGLEDRANGKSQTQFVIAEMFSLTLSVGKLKLIRFSKRYTHKIFRA